MNRDVVDAWFEKDERNEVHPRGPYHRIASFSTSPRVRVTRGGDTLAEPTRAIARYETGLPPGFYLLPADVRFELLQPSTTMSECPCKGTARHWGATVDGRTVPDVAWEYRDHVQRGAEAVQGRLAFSPDRVQVDVSSGSTER